MKTYKLYYEYYPFDVENMSPKSIEIKANSLESAFKKLEDLKGKDKIEIFKVPAKLFYKE